MVDDRYIARGRRRLLEWLPWARAEARKHEGQLTAHSVVGRGAFGAITAANLDAVLIYPAPLGGWHGDVLLRDMPPGFPNCVGTQVEHPMATRAEAEARAKVVLVGLLAHIARKPVPEPPPPPGFIFFDFGVQLLPELYEHSLAVMPEFVDGYGSIERAIEKMDEAVATVWPDGYRGEDINTLPFDDKVYLMTRVHIAALSGLYVYPPRRHGKPGTA